MESFIVSNFWPKNWMEHIGWSLFQVLGIEKKYTLMIIHSLLLYYYNWTSTDLFRVHVISRYDFNKMHQLVLNR